MPNGPAYGAARLAPYARVRAMPPTSTQFPPFVPVADRMLELARRLAR